MSELLLENLSRACAFCDPASGKQQLRRVRARSAIVVVAQDDLQRMFVLYAWAKRCSTDTLVKEIFSVAERFKVRLFGVEANAMQSVFVDDLRREARYREKRIPLVPVPQPTKVEKDWRIRAALQPVIAHGRLLTQPNQHELNNELATFPMSATKDLVDALASAISLIPAKSTRKQKDGAQASLARYLRETGASPSHIEERLAEVGGQSDVGNGGRTLASIGAGGRTRKT